MQRSKDIRENMKYSRTVGDLVQLEHLGCRGRTAGRNWWTEKLEGELEAAFPPFKEVGYHSPGNKRKKSYQLFCTVSTEIQFVFQKNNLKKKPKTKQRHNLVLLGKRDQEKKVKQCLLSTTPLQR